MWTKHLEETETVESVSSLFVLFEHHDRTEWAGWRWKDRLPSDMLFSTCRKHMRRLLISACSSLSHRRRELPRVEAGWFCRLDTHKQTLSLQEANSLMRASTTLRSESRQLRVGWCSVNCIIFKQERKGYIKALRVSMAWSPRRCGITVAKWR